MMAQIGDEGLAELIAREQRGFRGILFAGVATLMVMAVMSAVLGVYLYAASASLAQTTQTLKRHAFDTRRNVDAQNNRILAQEVAIRRIYDEIRAAAGEAQVAPTPENIDGAREAARAYLLRGRIPSLDEQRALTQFGPGGAGAVTPEMRALFTGVAALVTYETRGEEIAQGAAELPANLSSAVDAFAAARSDPALAPLASAGTAWVMFEDASSTRRNYSTQACSQVFNAVSATVRDEGSLGPQPLYWRAQCERKLGMTGPALADYALALRARSAAAQAGDRAGDSPDASELTLAMNAFHGVGTTLIASAMIPDDAPGMSDALAIAADACKRQASYSDRKPRMALALSCLSEAIALRRALGQTPNQQSGSGENMSFAHLRDGDFNAAYANAVAIERTGLFPWNELVRALSSSRARFDDPAAQRAAAVAEADARSNVAMFTVGQFNLCELQALFDPALYEDARKIVAEAHPTEEVGCAAAG